MASTLGPLQTLPASEPCWASKAVASSKQLNLALWLLTGSGASVLDALHMWLWPLSNRCDCRVIHTYCPQVHDELIKFGNKSGGGRGGMTAKVRCRKAVRSGASLQHD